MRKLVTLGGICVAVMLLVGVARAAEDRGGRRGGMLERLREDAPPEILQIIEKRQAGQDLTEEEQQRLRDYMRERGGEMRQRMMGRMLEGAPDDIRQLAEKQEKGDQLTEEEQGRLREYMRGRAAQFMRDRGAQRVQPRFQETFFPRVEANPRDAARLRIAEIKHDLEKHDEAIEILATIAGESPEPDVQAAAHLIIARIYRRNLLLPDKAAVEFLAVRGTLANQAISEMMEMYEQAGEPERSIELLRGAADNAEEKVDKVYYLGHLAEAYKRVGKIDDAIAALQEIVDMISYDEAMEMKDQLPPPPPLLQRPPFQPGRARRQP